jgi:hypothetical protein
MARRRSVRTTASLLLKASVTTLACSDGRLTTRLGNKGAMQLGDDRRDIGSSQEVAKRHNGDIGAS